MICTDIQPLQIVENKGFINFVRTLHADYILPDRKTLSERYLPQQYQLARSSLADKLEDVKNLALTTDMWTSDSNKSYLTVTVHFISESKLFARTLSTVEVKDVHSATVIANVLDTVLEEWRISNKVVTVVTDNASNIKKAVSEYLNKRNHFCVAHTLNLAVSDCKKSNLPLTSLLEKCHTVVTYFKQSTKAAYKLKELQEQMNHPVIKLKQEVITRWNSSFEMMERLLQTKLSLSAALSTMSSAPENFTANQWEAIEDCVSVLKPIEQLTTILSGEKYPTLSSMIPLIRNVQTCLIKKVPVTEIGENLKISLHSAITKRLGILETNKTAAKSTFLDPRYKKAGFGLEANAEKAAQWVIEELESEIIKKNRNLAPDESSQTVNTSSNANASIGTNNKANDLWEDFDKKISERELIQTPTSSAIVIVKQYREMQYLDRHLEPILFWEQRKKAMPELYELAIKYLCIPASSVPAERVFSKAALICNQRRNRLDSKKVDEIIFLNSYFS
ncbi:E3 SUMO-protein ligase ZBED1-like [Amyelois transitella]|uniref:E3 SUMO-protein ligase ZBED1-like n=1 Tax=Amyelois transitella TaxID=680683 RepID=UPI00298FF4B3|nr:E3 SUMO-protein ligase ZBED1-like [Amyelois transitella]